CWLPFVNWITDGLKIPCHTTVDASPEAWQSLSHGDVRVGRPIIASEVVPVSSIEEVVDSDTCVQSCAQRDLSGDVHHRIAGSPLFAIRGRHPVLSGICHGFYRAEPGLTGIIQSQDKIVGSDTVKVIINVPPFPSHCAGYNAQVEAAGK